MDTTPELQPPVVAPVTKHAPIAPYWHTFLLVGFIVLFSALSANSKHAVGQSHREILYLTSLFVEWLMFGYVVWGIHSAKRTSVREVIGGRWSKAEDFLLDVAIAAGFWIVAFIVLGVLGYGLGLTGQGKVEEAKKVLSFLAPQTITEAVLFGLLCITAGFCEEFIFRGYLQRQFAALSNNAMGGIVASSIVFGLAHGYEGAKRMLLIAVYGAMFGVLVHFRKSLRPAMMAHTWHDAFTGAMLYVLSKVKLP